MLATILSILAIVWFAGCAITVREIARAPIGQDENESDNLNE